MVLGDSFAYGVRGSADLSFSGVLQAAFGPEVEVDNLGIPGWGIDQMYLAYQRYRDVLHPTYVILAFIDDDVARVLESHRSVENLTKPSFAIADGRLVARGAPTLPERALNALGRRSVLVGLLARELHLAWAARPIVRRIIHDMARETTARGERLAVFRIPLPTSATATFANVPGFVAAVNRRWNDFADVVEDTNVVYLDPWEELRDRPDREQAFYLDDGHLSARGHAFMAEYLARRVFGRDIGG